MNLLNKRLNMNTVWANEKKNTLRNQEAHQSPELNLQVKSHRKVSVLIHFLHTKHYGREFSPTIRMKLFLPFCMQPKDTGCTHQWGHFLYPDWKLTMGWLKVIFSTETVKHLLCPNIVCEVQDTYRHHTGISPGNHYNVRMDTRNS